MIRPCVVALVLVGANLTAQAETFLTRAAAAKEAERLASALGKPCKTTLVETINQPYRYGRRGGRSWRIYTKAFVFDLDPQGNWVEVSRRGPSSGSVRLSDAQAWRAAEEWLSAIAGPKHDFVRERLQNTRRHSKS